MDNNGNRRKLPERNIREVHPTELRRGKVKGTPPENIHIKNVTPAVYPEKKTAVPSVKASAAASSTQKNGAADTEKGENIRNVRYIKPGVSRTIPSKSQTAANTAKAGNNISRRPPDVPKKTVQTPERENEIYYRNLMNLIVCAVFAFIVLAGFAVVSVHMMNPNKPTYSEYEKRNLEGAPEFSFSTLADGSFTEDFDRFFSDNFPMREKMVQGATVLKRFRGIRLFNKDAKQVIHGDTDIYSEGDIEISVDEEKFSNAELIVIPGVTNTENVDSAMPDNSDEAGSESNLQPTGGFAHDVNSPEQTVPGTPGQNVDVGTAKGEKRDTIYLLGDTAYEYFRGSTKSADDYIAVINTYAKYIPDSVNIYNLVIPTHPEFGLEGADRTVSNDQKPVIDHIGKNLDSRVTFVNPYDKLYSRYKNGEYLYFRTDHHWTVRGAYCAYEAFCESANITPVSESNYETGRIEPFLGTFYSAANREPELKNNPDYVEYYMIDIPCTVTRYDAGNNASAGRLYYKSVKGEANGYLAFMGGDFPYVYIKTENANGKKLMIFKESFGNPLIGLLAPHFEEIHVADIRYFRYNSVNFIKQYGITDVLFCNGIMSANSKARVNDLMGLMNK